MGQFYADNPIDARLASWLAVSTLETVGYHTVCGLRLPEEEDSPQGRGPGWKGRAVTAVLRQCYAKGLSKPTLEDIEVVAISVLPQPEEGDEAPLRPPSVPSLMEKWERAILSVAETACTVLRHGPASGSAGAEVLFSGGSLQAEYRGLPLQQRVDLLWRRPDRTLEAVLLFEEPSFHPARVHPEEDWRCVLAAAVVRALYGENPDLHLVWVSDGAARVTRLPDALLDWKVGELVRILEEAELFAGVGENSEGVFYRLYGEAPNAPNEPAPNRRRSRRRPSDAERRGTD